MNPVDIVSTLQALQMLKYWKGKHLVLKRQVRFSSAACSLLDVLQGLAEQSRGLTTQENLPLKEFGYMPLLLGLISVAGSDACIALSVSEGFGKLLSQIWMTQVKQLQLSSFMLYSTSVI